MKNFIKKSLSFFLAITMLFTITAGIDLSAYAGGGAFSDYAEADNYQYGVLADGTAHITRYYGESSEITIPSEINGYKVTGLGEPDSFQNDNLTRINIPDSVTKIAASAFRRCDNLVCVKILNSNCEFMEVWGYRGDVFPQTTTIYGYKNSTAEAYAREYGNKFIALECTHFWDAGKVTKQPTATTAGVKTYTCTKCKATKTETIKATGLKTPVLKAAVNVNGTFTLSWNKVAGAEKYELYIKQADGSYKLMKTTTGTSFTTAIGAYGYQYTYKMRAVKGNTKSAYSSAVNAKNTKKLQTPSAKVTVNANGSFKLSWNKVTGATKYGIYMKQTNGSYKWIKTVTGTSWSTATAQYGKQYSYKILAANNNKSAQTFSNVVNAKNTKKLTTPTLKVAVNKNGSFKLSWGKVTGATSYQIYMKQSNGSYKLIKTTTSTSFTTALAAKGKTYSYKVRAVTSKNKNATSNYSSVVSAKRK